jgi:hypothetical protein
MKPGDPFHMTRLWRDSWEVWELSQDHSTEPRLLPANVSPAVSAVLSVPARSVVAVPLWIDSVDPAVISESVDLELEVRGVLTRKNAADAIRLHEIQREGRTLVICAVFATEIPLSGQSFDRYEPSPLLVHIPTDGITLWREGQDLVAAFSAEGHVVYWATTDADCDASALHHWLSGVTSYLQALQVIPSHSQPIIADEDSVSRFAADSVTAQALPPILPAKSSGWVPDDVRERLFQQTRRQKWLRFAALALVPYLLILLSVALYFGWLAFRANNLRHQLASLEQEASLFHSTSRDWRLIRAAVDSDYYPVEILYGLVQNMPPDGLRLTLYDVTDGIVTLQGEAVSASQASDFFSSVSAVPALQPLRWQMPTPALLPNNAAQFQLTGNIP